MCTCSECLELLEGDIQKKVKGRAIVVTDNKWVLITIRKGTLVYRYTFEKEILEAMALNKIVEVVIKDYKKMILDHFLVR